jgi:hypothetical protein
MSGFKVDTRIFPVSFDKPGATGKGYHEIHVALRPGSSSAPWNKTIRIPYQYSIYRRDCLFLFMQEAYSVSDNA